MKLVKFPLTVLILFVCFQICFGQEKQAVLSDTFKIIPLGELWARIDTFVQQLQRNSNSKAYIVIYPEKESAKLNFRLEVRYAQLINNRIYQQNNFDERRIKIGISKVKDDFEVKLWTIPESKEIPFMIEREWSESPPDLTKPFIFGEEDMKDPYPYFAPKRYANLIKNNSNLRGHIVIFNKSKKERQVKAQEWIKEFTEEYKVPRSQLKIFFGNNKGNPDVEFWIVPHK
jgi:hypothetical protein